MSQHTVVAWPWLLLTSLTYILGNRCRPFGLTGGIAAGKSTISQLFRAHGAVIIDADDIARGVLEPGTWGYKRLRASLSRGTTPLWPQVCQADGRVDRQALREAIFATPAVRRVVNQATHLPVFVELLRQLILARLWYWRSFVVLDAPLLLESGLDRLCHTVVLVTAPERTRIERVMRRDSVTETQAKATIAVQMVPAEQIKRAQVVFENSGTQTELRNRVDAWLQQQGL
ncbi:uncharacterized protein MONBRDRAFT_15103 [Monosiga brevicollis MX1]|uniref:Dephospho-CoA kinase n=1 Tax=Monosiga brevicollis TaxID=81824 RepID=A9UTM3_MONBE|nr:uncharacterized protein MONBRDRAFT_15103 [Monosiga brevicollis MX1]EDQ91519.1 predicted protein [Monosiga brevicollis MX1]|eukprot:XP_001743941.1 hypothetical protein [Monosiga brevicollis MX1]